MEQKSQKTFGYKAHQVENQDVLTSAGASTI